MAGREAGYETGFKAGVEKALTALRVELTRAGATNDESIASPPASVPSRTAAADGARPLARTTQVAGVAARPSVEEQLVGAGFFAAAGGGVLGGGGAVEEHLVQRVRSPDRRRPAGRVALSMRWTTMPGRLRRSPCVGRPAVALAMKSAQIGAAALPPVSPRPSFFMSSKPTQTAASRSGVKPTNQASRWSVRGAGLARRRAPQLARDRGVRGPLVDHAAHQRHHDVGDLGLQRRRQLRRRLRLAAQRADRAPAARRCRRWRTWQ